jgi:3-oxo-5-alpha-steroid 4-dehydrogenase 1
MCKNGSLAVWECKYSIIDEPLAKLCHKYFQSLFLIKFLLISGGYSLPKMTEKYFDQIIIAWIILAILVFMVNLKIVAPYGRHASKKWGILINNRLAWILMESPVLLILSYNVLPRISSLNVVPLVLFILFTLHYVNRTFIFPFRIRGSSKKMPLAVMLLAVIFNVFNGFFIGYYLANFANYETSWLLSIPFILGALLFSIGTYINWRADSILIGLRKEGFSGYKIPYGFMFGKVSCPNHFGEMIEWGGYALMSFNLPALAFAVWTAANLIPRALAHHRWYKNYFPDYPTNRKAFLPGLW